MPANEIPVRKMSFPFSAEIPRHWFGGNPVETHIFNGLNLVFPDGERFFVRAVQDCAARIDAPELSAQIKGFSGQEGRHAHEHERYFATMREQGYEIDDFLRRFRKFCALSTRYVPASLRLSITAGAEHYTATLGAVALANPHLDAAHPTMHQLIRWHAIEEIEHKSVAFDVLRQTNPSYLLRIAGFLLATAVIAGWSGVAMRMLLRQDGVDEAEQKKLLRGLEKRDKGAMRRAIRAGFRDYFRRDFHPEQNDDSALVERHLPELGYAAA